MCPRAANPFQRSAQMAAAATAGITQSALQEANALLDLRVQGTPSGAAAGNATLSAGSRFSPQPPQNPGSGNQPDPMTSPAAADRASAQQQQQQQHVPTMRLLSGHNSGNTFSGVPHGFRVEAGGDAAALLCNGGGGMMGSGGAADGAEARGAGTPHTVKTTSRGSTGGDMGPPPPSATVRTPSDNHSQVRRLCPNTAQYAQYNARPGSCTLRRLAQDATRALSVTIAACVNVDCAGSVADASRPAAVVAGTALGV